MQDAAQTGPPTRVVAIGASAASRIDSTTGLAVGLTHETIEGRKRAARQELQIAHRPAAGLKRGQRPSAGERLVGPLGWNKDNARGAAVRLRQKLGRRRRRRAGP